MPLRDTGKYDLKIKGEPKEVTEIRKKIIESFDNLEFVDEGHKYFLHRDDGTVEELTSVSNISHLFQEEFNTEERSADYAKKHGETPEYWADKWKFNSLKATTTGTLVHAFAESYGWLKAGHPELITEECKCKYVPEKNWLVPTRPKEEAAMKCLDELNENLHLVMNETKVYTTDFSTNYAGTFDALYYYKDPKNDANSGLVIMDWKTNADIYNDYSRAHGKMLYTPFNGYYVENYSNYTIQLGCYQIPLENIGLKVIARRLLWLKEDGSYEVVKINDVTKELREFLK